MPIADDSTLAGGARRFGRTDLVVSRLGYGAMELAGPPKARALAEADVARFLNTLIDSGVTYIDTSIDYGLSETLIGKAVSHRRQEFVLASKCACEVGVEGAREGHEKHTYTGANVRAGVEQSLRRLKTDHLDVVQVHGNPTRKELEDGGVISTLVDLRREGLVRYIGISSRLPLLAEFIDLEEFDLVQLPYSALQRTNEDAIKALRENGKAVIARGVTGRGAPAKNWATRPIGTREGEVRELWERARLDDLIGDMPRVEFMIRFVLSNPGVDVALVATTNPEHLAANIEIAGRGPLDPGLYAEALKRIDEAGGGAGQGAYRSGGPTPIV